MRRKFSSTKKGVTRWPADDWFSKCVRLAAENRCESCGGEATDCAHIYGRAKFATRWCKDNAIALCRTCHNNYGAEPCMWTDFIDAKWPGRRDRLLMRLRKPGKNTPEIRVEVSKHYNQEFRRMEKTGDREFESWN